MTDWFAIFAKKELEELAVRRPSDGKWIVDIKGKAGDQSFEIALVREGNVHGFRSYGWFDKNKLLISSSGGPCHTPLIQLVWDKQVKLAHEVAKELNKQEKRK